MARLIINCDLGENETAAQTEALMALVDAANICCGVHAGSLDKTRAALVVAKRCGVMVGAHPGLGLAGGRGGELPTLQAFRELLDEQLATFFALAAEVGVPVAYVKLHGSLYSAVEADAALLSSYMAVLQGVGQKCGLFALAGGRCVAAARELGLTVYEEVFADRGYTLTGALVPRSSAGALLDVASAQRRFDTWYETQRMPTNDGRAVCLAADTVCVHSDSPGSLQLIRTLKARIEQSRDFG